MQGLMQDWPLTCDKILTHASITYPDRTIVTRSLEGPIERRTYADIDKRARRVSSDLKRRWNIGFGDRVGTIAWNTARHLESWYAICGLGAVYHTINPRLAAHDIRYIINHAEDRVILTDVTFLPILETIQDALTTVEAFVVMTDHENMPATSLRGAVPYEDLVSQGDGDVAWGGFDENAACGLCYTSGTTGNPKGVVYSHRGNVIHALVCCMSDVMGLSGRDVILPIVPLFHANAWALAFSAPMTGARLVMPGMKLDGASIYELLDQEKVTLSAAVPTVWLDLMRHLRETGARLPHLRRVIIGGSAVPEVMLRTFEDAFDVEVIHAWGMTEMSPLGTLGVVTPEVAALPREAQIRQKLKQGVPPFTVEMRVRDAEGRETPRDGKAFGRLEVRGPGVASGYFKNEGGDPLTEDGWLKTGDVATIDPYGYMQIVDREKDVIKSGGEWISTIELENVAAGHPDIEAAAVIGVHHPKWFERPLLIVEPRAGASVDEAALLAFIAPQVAKWWLPDAVVSVDALPRGATGKIDKRALRERFKGFSLPTAERGDADA